MIALFCIFHCFCVRICI